MILFRFIFFALLFISADVFAEQAITFDPKLTEYRNFSIEIFEDSLDQYTVLDIEKQTEWEKSNNNFSFGYSASSFWLKFTVDNPTDVEQKINLLFSESFFATVDLYQKNNNIWVKRENGVNVKVSKREVNHPLPVFMLTLPATQKTVYLVNIKGDFGLFGSLLLLKQEPLYQFFSLRDSIHVFMFGAIGIIALYNLFLWFSLRDKIYLYYVAYAAGYLGWLILYSGFVLRIFPLEWFKTLNGTLPFAFVFLILFSQELLNTKRSFPKIDKLLTLIALSFFLAMLIIPFQARVGFHISNILAIFALPLLLLLGIKGIINQVANAKIYTLALLVYYVGMTILASVALGLLSYNSIIRYAPFPGSMLELILFSFALADRINRHKQQAIEAQAKLLLVEQNANKELEAKVKERTQDLQKQQKQLEILSQTDSLTNLYNRRAFRDIFETSMSSMKEGQQLALVMIDIDYFKNYNDSYGHQKGDEALV